MNKLDNIPAAAGALAAAKCATAIPRLATLQDRELPPLPRTWTTAAGKTL
jgi:hypothetical protein